jgi:hypothetical protein
MPVLKTGVATLSVLAKNTLLLLNDTPNFNEDFFFFKISPGDTERNPVLFTPFCCAFAVDG